MSFSPLHENASSPLLDLESIALGVLLRSNQRSSSYLFLHMLRHLSLIFTEVRPGGKGYLIRVWVRAELGLASRLRARARARARARGFGAARGYSARIFAQMSLSCLYLRSPCARDAARGAGGDGPVEAAGRDGAEA